MSSQAAVTDSETGIPGASVASLPSRTPFGPGSEDPAVSGPLPANEPNPARLTREWMTPGLSLTPPTHSTPAHMAEHSPTTQGGGTAANDEFELLEILRLLIQTKRAKTTADLLRYASQYVAPEVEERLRVLDSESVPLSLAFDAVSVQLRLSAHRQNSALLAECRGRKVGLVMPLPPEVMKVFFPVADVSFFQPEPGVAHGPPPEFTAEIVLGARNCRARSSDMHALVFETFREGKTLFADMAIADLLEPKLLPAGIRLISHLRPHKNPRDVALTSGQKVSFI